MTRPGVARILVPAALYLAAFVPALVALMRVWQVPTGTLPIEKLYLAESPVSMVLHGICGAAFALLGPLQLFPSLRRRFPRLHRRLGYGLVAAGATIALSGLAMVVFHPFSAIPVLRATRAVVGTMILISLTLAILAVRRRNIAQHRAWMLRSFALIMGAGSQAVVGLSLLLIFGPPAPEVQDLINALCWPLNLLIAEWVIRHPQRPALVRKTSLPVALSPMASAKAG